MRVATEDTSTNQKTGTCNNTNIIVSTNDSVNQISIDGFSHDRSRSGISSKSTKESNSYPFLSNILGVKRANIIKQ